MSSDSGDPCVTTDELPLLVASVTERVRGDVGLVVSGRARPVVMSDSQRAFRWEPDDDPSVIPERFAQPFRAPLPDDQPGRALRVVVAFMIFGVPAMLAVALMVALAVR